MANCHFAISTSAGLDAISEIFRRPMVFVNHLPVGNLKTGDVRHIELFKRLRWKESKEPLSLREQIETGAVHCFSSQQFESLGLDIEDNTEDEIMEAVLEMEARLGNEWVEHASEQILQDKFFSILQKWDNFRIYHGSQRSRVAAKFLRDNHAWFLN
jgi:putative glycosyltransferase (TIGR04372 family)